MSIIEATAPIEVEKFIYPESDGNPMADNSKQFRWITTIEGNLEILFAHEPDVFIAGDMLWYPLLKKNKTCQAPDIMVVFGRPKGDRGSYAQAEEGNIAPQVVFEILSPSNTKGEMEEKFVFYETHGVEEYYVYDPQRGTLQGWQRQHQGSVLVQIKHMISWVSPRLGIQFELENTLEGLELALYYPDGRRFLSYVELGLWAESETAARVKAETRAAVEFEARIKEAKARVREAKARVKAEARAKEETEARIKAETLATVEVEARIRETRARFKAETRAEKAETRAEKAETRAEAEAEARATEAKARAKAEARAKELEAKLKQAGLL